MKIILLFLCSTFLLAQVEVQNDELKNKLMMNFNQQSGYFDFKYKQDLSLAKNNELMKVDLTNYTAQAEIPSLNKQEERIPYEYDPLKSNGQNFVQSVIHELFLSKPIRL
ncbi:hypothetical protein [Empedobacter brevis]|uniref:Uncharacterized protein n=1 Tax=Empedobacter brevis NBRC 14943 = ATCC 43319 TaxID=1218108 RepID=A0A511NH90_9FLAO|nr:hypothetical protein [Empedobacter brevis]GEM51868.1 hypothetical protein EB1_16580 [Empedobacter brevis NBRC 14943 = ATCC 43319]